jgi:hypothetical protein
MDALNPEGLPFPRTWPDPRSILAPEPNSNGTRYRVAVVGNGPLRDEDRPRIAAHRNIVRFNDAKNAWPGERVTIHVGVHLRLFAANASRWAIVNRWQDVDAQAYALVSLNYGAQASAPWLDLGRLFSGARYRPETLGPWADTLRVFPRCANCTGDRCLLAHGYSGMSSGGTVIEQLDALEPPLEAIEVFGMNWNEDCKNNLDFRDPALIRDCCARCVIHPTASDRYLPLGYMSHAEQLRAVLAFVVAPFTASALCALLLCVRQWRLRRLRKRQMYVQPDLD